MDSILSIDRIPEWKRIKCDFCGSTRAVWMVQMSDGGVKYSCYKCLVVRQIVDKVQPSNQGDLT